MKFLVSKDSETGAKLTALRTRITACTQAAKDFAATHGWEQWLSDSWYVSGNIAGVYFPEQPSGWKRRGEAEGKTFYSPRSTKANAALLQQLADLPKVSRQQYNSAIGYTAGPFGLYGLADCGDCWLLDMTETHVPKPLPADMVEITVTEYRARLDATKAPAAQ
ncbi:hypothetical protein [Hymenobacter sp. B81]|uniref:hypothetical protein n=1 Tax=Hymenobacter sp. B81 TaxID=3344878 RepID=UPI0037DD04AF